MKVKFWGKIAICFLLIGLVFTGCSVNLKRSDAYASSNVNITINGSTSVCCGSSASLTATVVSSKAVDKTVSWSSKDSSICSIDSSGVITAKKTGNTLIYATCGGVTKSHSVNVGLKVRFNDIDGTTLQQSDLIYRVGDEVSDPNLDTNKTNYNFTGWYYKDNKVDSDVNYTIPENLSGEDGFLTFTGKWDPIGTSYTVAFDVNGGVWTATSEETLSVAYNGTVSKPNSDPTKDDFVFAGWFTNLSSSNSYDFSTKITSNLTLTAKWVDAVVNVTGLTVSPSSLSLAVGESSTLQANVLPVNETNTAVIWTSSNSTIASVGTSGNVTAVAVGEATITATAVDGAKTSSCSVTVTKPQKKLVSISIDSSDDSVKVDESITFTAVATYDDGSTETVTSATSFVGNTSYVTISGNTVTGKLECDSVTITGTYEENLISKTATKNIKVEKGSETFDGVRIFVAKSLNYPMIYYWSCDDDVKYPKPVWPGVSMLSYDSSDYYFAFEGVATVSLLITKSDGSKLYSKDMVVTEKGDYRVTSSGIEKISKSAPLITISPASGTVYLTDKINITVTSVGTELTSASAIIYGQNKTLSAGTNLFDVSDFTTTKDVSIGISVSATNEIGTTTKTATLTTKEKLSNLTGNFNELIMYQVMVSSFQDGDTSIGYTTAYGPSGALTGGDLQGIINSLDYIKSLGCNALWMTPIFNSNGSSQMDSTGYYTYDYFDIDPKFGTKAKFKELVDACHEKDMYVILDGVFGHWGTSIKASPNNKSPSRSHGQYNGCDYPASLDFFNEVADYWIDQYNIDGWRLDQCYQAGVAGNNVYTGGHNYWYEIRQTVEAAAAKNVSDGDDWGTLGYMVGEDWESQEKIQANSVSPGSASGYGLRSCFDFPSRYNIVNSFAKAEWDSGGNSLGSSLSDVYKSSTSKGYTHPNGYYPNLFITNHDIARFGNLLNWKDGLTKSSTLYWQRHKLALATLAAYTGPITIYYGDEWGAYVDDIHQPATGNNSVGNGAYIDNCARSTGKISDFSPNEQDLVDYASSLLKMRAENEALWNGEATTLSSDSTLYVGKKTLNGTTIIFMINNGSSSRSYAVGSSGTDLLTNNSTGTSVSVDAYSARFIKLN